MHDPSDVIEDPNCPQGVMYFINPSELYKGPMIEWIWEDSEEVKFSDSYNVTIKEIWEYSELRIPHNFVLGTE